MPINSEPTVYDELPYPSLIFYQTHPDKLAAIGQYYGIDVASPQKCRVLELGCGVGTNLLWLAHSLPESEFIGIDLSKVQIAQANQVVSELNLTNIKFFQQDVMEIDAETFGKFDYIIAHGLFSWVPDFVRQKTLEIYRQLLNPNGIGYISYNAFPGCYRRQIARDIMLYYSRKIENPLEKIDAAINFFGFVTNNSQSNPIQFEIYKYELEKILTRSKSNIYHDDLSENNQPFYFSEFIGLAEQHGLQFLSDTETFTTQPRNLSPDVMQAIESISENLIEFEQYIDFFNNNRFRRTLLCHQEIQLDRNFDSEKIKRFFISSDLRPVSENIELSSPKAEKFISRSGKTNAETSHPLTKAALFYLNSIGTHRISFADLVSNSRQLLENEGFTNDNWENEVETLASLFFQLQSAESIRFHVCQSRAVNFVGEKPKTSEFARWQIKNEVKVTSLHGLNFSFDDKIAQQLLLLLDGTRTQDDVIKEVTNNFYNENLNITKQKFIEEISTNLANSLERMAKNGLLI